MTKPKERLIKLTEASHRTGHSKTQIKERLVPQGRFPPPVEKPHPNSPWLFPESEIDEYIEKQKAVRYIPPKKPANDDNPPSGG